MNIIIRKQKQRTKVVTQTSDIIGRAAPSSHPAPLHFVREPLKHKLTTIFAYFHKQNIANKKKKSHYNYY